MKKYLMLFLICLFAAPLHLASTLSAREEKGRPTICLNMIVKNESAIMPRCLGSLASIIDYWVIVDTGSTDGTQKVIKDFMKQAKIPGELHERPWKNFGYNRNEALDLAKNKADYILFIDADEYLVFDKGFSLPILDKDFYYLTVRLGGSRYPRLLLVSAEYPWRWIGAVHEVLQPTADMTHATLENVFVESTRDGDRAKDPEKYKKDAELLESALVEEPNNTRYMFYLAQSYRDAGLSEKAIEKYRKRIEMGGWREELFWSKLQIAVLQERLRASQDVIVKAYFEAYESNPQRAEPLYYLANYFRRQKDFRKCYEISKLGINLKPIAGALFTEQWIYDYGILLECSVGAYWIGRYGKCERLSLQILKNPEISENIRNRVLSNLSFAQIKLLEKVLAEKEDEGQKSGHKDAA